MESDGELKERPTDATICAALRKWRNAIAAAGDAEITCSLHDIDRVFLAIQKSDLLYRLAYNGEELRERRCPDPQHDGHWRGIEHDENRCPHGCGLTGWLPKEPAEKAEPPPHLPFKDKGVIGQCWGCGQSLAACICRTGGHTAP